MHTHYLIKWCFMKWVLRFASDIPVFHLRLTEYLCTVDTCESCLYNVGWVVQLMVHFILLHINKSSAWDWLLLGGKNCRALSTVQTLPLSGSVNGEPLGPETNAGIFPLAYERCTSANFERILDSWALFGRVAWQLSTGRIMGINADGSLNMAAVLVFKWSQWYRS
jgi:hypothetical protein